MSKEILLLNLPVELTKQVVELATVKGITPEQLIIQILEKAYPTLPQPTGD